MIYPHFLLLILSSLGTLSYSFKCIEYHGRTEITQFGSATSNVILEDRFSRWRFLQQILDEESEEHQTNLILGQVLRNYLDSSVTDHTAAPEHTEERVSAVQAVLKKALPDGSIPVLPNCDLTLFDLLESTLPNPNEDEEAYKSNWDTVMEIHGRESVKLNEQEGNASWKTSCLVARVLLFYDFLTSD